MMMRSLALASQTLMTKETAVDALFLRDLLFCDVHIWKESGSFSLHRFHLSLKPIDHLADNSHHAKYRL